MEIIVPTTDEDKDGSPVPWPTLGPQICDFMEERLAYGPGMLKGEPYVVRDDIRYILYRAYEHYPKGYIAKDGSIETDMSGRRRFNEVTLSLPKGWSKCLDPETELILESGERIKAGEAKPGQSILSYDGEKAVYRKIVAAEEQPLAMTYRVKTAHGREITVSEGHPFLVSGTQWREGMPKYFKYTANDPKRGEESWSKVEDLAPGDRLVPALGWKTGGTEGDSALGWLAGVFAGDSSGDGRLTNGDREITRKVAEHFDLTQLTQDGKPREGNWYAKKSRSFMEKFGLWGKNAHTKRVPEEVMRGSREMALGYLAGLLDTDGCTVYKPAGGKKVDRCAEWYSVSESNMRDLQTLLASVGFNADVRAKRSSYKGEPYVSWTVVISNKADLKRLAEQLPVVRGRNKENFEKFRKLDSRGNYGDVNLDKVETIEPLGEAVTIGIEVDGTHVHVTNGLITHNTELMALICLVELHPESPVRFNGYDENAPGGMAPGRSVVSPYIPLLAPTKDQLHDLAYGVCMEVAKIIPDADLFDATLDRILIKGESESKIVPVAASASRLDGLKPTFQGIDESHRLYEDRQRQAVGTMKNNLPKRMADDPWQLTVTTAGDPSQPSVAKDQFEFGMRMAAGKVSDPNRFFYHRGTSDENAKFDTMEQRIIALREASGEEASKMRDLRVVARWWDDANADKTYLERVWCNRWVQSSASAFDVQAFKHLGDPSLIIEQGSFVTLGFDGAQTQDSTALVMTDIETGIQNLVGLWERPPEADSWQVPVGEVYEVVDMIFKNYDVWTMYCDPPYWQEAISRWSEMYEGKIIEWWTKRTEQMYYALRAYSEAIMTGEVGHDGNPDLVRHIGNAGKNELNTRDDEGLYKYRLAKIDKDRKFDAAMAATLSWQARLDALKKNADRIKEPQMPMRVR